MDVWLVRSPCVSACRLHAHQTQLQYQPGTSLAQDPLEGREAPLRKSHVARISPFAVRWRVAKRQEYSVDVKKDNPERSPRRRRRSPSRHGGHGHGRGLSAGERAKPKQARCRRQAGAVEAFASWRLSKEGPRTSLTSFPHGPRGTQGWGRRRERRPACGRGGKRAECSQA